MVVVGLRPMDISVYVRRRLAPPDQMSALAHRRRRDLRAAAPYLQSTLM
jgi:hypothetical protein